jgi:hypothetical protein
MLFGHLTDVNIPGRSSFDGIGKARSQRITVSAPANFDCSSLDKKAVMMAISQELVGSVGFDERDKLIVSHGYTSYLRHVSCLRCT